LIRLDTFIVQNSLACSKTKAQELIKNALVLVDGTVALKCSLKVDGKLADVKIKENKNYVSRAAWKLANFLDEISLSVKDKNALDIGSSTGGFTQVLLDRGALHVNCVDVGDKQLHPLLQNDIRVSMYENTDIRKFDINETFDLVTSDVSFISLLKILDDIDRLANDDIILLFKPQFEVGRLVKRDKKGVVKDEKAIQKAMIVFEDACSLKNWTLINKATSKLAGKEGNVEYCYYYKKM